MPRLVMTASPLRERWSVTAVSRRDRVQWPPAPDTLFSALVAASASLGDPMPDALRWLETLGHPAIEPDLRPPRVEAIRTFVPVADRPLWKAGSRQERWQNSVQHPGPVRWSWHAPEPPAQHVQQLHRIAREVTYIGSSRGPVLAAVHVTEAPLPPEALVPEASGPFSFRSIYPGRLDDLETAFRAGRRPNPGPEVRYVQLIDRHVRSVWGQMIPLRRVTGQRLHITAGVPLAEAVRTAISSHLPDGAPAVLTGHDDAGGTLADVHMAVVPLANVGNRYADGDILGVGLLLPVNCNDGDFALLVEGLGRWLAAGGLVRIGAIAWQMEIAHEDHRRALHPNRLGGYAAMWTTVLPAVCNRHPRRQLRLADVVADMCREVGLPEPADVEGTAHPHLIGAADSQGHFLGGRVYLTRSPITHLRVTWARPVPGPILLGRGRYFGLGAMLPMKAAA